MPRQPSGSFSCARSMCQRQGSRWSPSESASIVPVCRISPVPLSRMPTQWAIRLLSHRNVLLCLGFRNMYGKCLFCGIYRKNEIHSPVFFGFIYVLPRLFFKSEFFGFIRRKAIFFKNMRVFHQISFFLDRIANIFVYPFHKTFIVCFVCILAYFISFFNMLAKKNINFSFNTCAFIFLTRDFFAA